MDKQNYKPRVIDAKVKEYLSAFGAVCIEGPKWCGKTWTSSYHSKSEIYDYADGAALGVTDAYFVDGFHGSEVTYAYLLKDMAAKNQSVKDAVNLKKMDELICGRYSEKVFFDPDERHG